MLVTCYSSVKRCIKRQHKLTAIRGHPMTPSSPSWSLNILISLAAAAGLVMLAYAPSRPSDELPNRIPRAAPYVTSETESVAPPFEAYWKANHNPGKCSTCHGRIFAEWNG